tara:strand:- start:52 stop:219 length:168 start_codon:yes stop_codon:yes gene_type:complete
MNTLFKFIIIPAFAFGVLDWAADNPAKVKTLRNQIVIQFEQGVEAAADELDTMAQ